MKWQLAQGAHSAMLANIVLYPKSVSGITVIKYEVKTNVWSERNSSE